MTQTHARDMIKSKEIKILLLNSAVLVFFYLILLIFYFFANKTTNGKEKHLFKLTFCLLSSNLLSDRIFVHLFLCRLQQKKQNFII